MDDFKKARDKANYEQSPYRQIFTDGADWAYEWCCYNKVGFADSRLERLTKEADALAEALTNATIHYDRSVMIQALTRWNKFKKNKGCEDSNG